MADYEKALRCLNKLNNYSKLPVDHRWVSTIRHYIKDKNFSSHNSQSDAIALLKELHDTVLLSSTGFLYGKSNLYKRINAVLAQQHT